MENVRKNEVIEIELCDLDLSLGRTRIKKARDISRIQASIVQFGQITPVSVIQDDKNRWLLVDGYRRIMAMRALGFMQAMAEVWLCDEKSALIRVMTSSQGRQWEPIEQAIMIQELCHAHQLSQSEISRLLGCSQSWVSRRIALIEALPSEIIQNVMHGLISPWSATRVLAPMSRAISSHALQLSGYLSKTGLSTRDVSEFWDAYRKSGQKVRQRMVDSPDLFFRAQRQKKADLAAKELRDGIEAKWQKDMRICFNILSSQESKIDKIFCPLQKAEYKTKLLNSLLGVLEKGFELQAYAKRRINEHREGEKRDDFANEQEWNEYSRYLSFHESIPELCSQNNQGTKK